jgi:hypothetical protein
MRIEELVIENHNLEEGPRWDAAKQFGNQALNTVGKYSKDIGQGVGNVAGGVGQGLAGIAGGAVGAYDRMKQGFNQGRSAVNRKHYNPYSNMPDAPNGTGGQQQAQQPGAVQGAQGQQAGGAQGQDPNQLRQQGKALIQQADELEKQQKSQQQQQQSNTQQQNTQQAQNTSGGVPTGSASNADGGSNAPANTQQQNTAPANATEPPADANAPVQPPADANATQPPADANATPPAGTTPPANNQQQQKQAGDQRDAKSVAAATKARLQGQRQAGTSMAKSAGNNFSNWVGGSPNYKGFDAQGNAIPNKIKREDMMFKSRFLEGWI